MNPQEKHHGEPSGYEYNYKDGLKFGLATMKWYGWGSPVGLGLFLLAIGGVIYLLHLAGLVG